MAKVYTKEEIDYLRKISKGKSNDKMTEMFNRKFGTNKSGYAIQKIRNKNKIRSGIDTKFKKGVPSAGALPIGTERIANGYAEIKINNNNCKTDWIRKHVKIWEEHHGEVPDNHIIMFGDGNKENFDIDNLICVSKAQRARLNKNNLIQDDAELTRAAIKVVDLEMKINERRKK